MSKNLYEVLGVDKTAPEKDIRKAYRTLAKKLHPDLNPGNEQAEEAFKEISAAYNILGDKKKRAQYDRGEIDEAGAERPKQQFYREYADSNTAHPYASSAGYEDFVDVSDIFSDLLKRSGGDRTGSIRLKGADVRYHFKVEFLDAANGAMRRVTMPDRSRLDVSIPAGVRDGQVLRLKGKGLPGLNGGPPGDALIEIEVAPHKLFRREGADIVLEFPIALHEAVLGAKVEVPTLSGRAVLSVPKGASSGQTLRMRGKGVKLTGSRRHGDQRVVLKIVMPDTIDPELKTFFEEWRKKNDYNPRKNITGLA